MFSIIPKCEVWFVQTLYIHNFGCTCAFDGGRARIHHHGCTARPLADRGERHGQARRRAQSRAKSKKSRLWPTVRLDHSAVARHLRRRCSATAPWVHGPTACWSSVARLTSLARSQKSGFFKCVKVSSGARGRPPAIFRGSKSIADHSYHLYSPT